MFDVTLSVANCKNCVGIGSLSRFPVVPQPAVVADHPEKDKLASDRRGMKTGRMVVSSIGASRLSVRMAISSRFNSELKFGWINTFDTAISIPILAISAAFKATTTSVPL